MQAGEVRVLLIGLLKKIAGRDGVPESMDDNLPLHEQMRLDSMDFLDLAIEIRKETNVSIPEADYRNLNSLVSLVNYIAARAAESRDIGRSRHVSDE